MSEILKVQSLSKRFSGLLAIDKLSFSLNRGEILGLIGPNGAGKTTLVNLISGVFRQTEGSILFENLPIDTYPIYKRSEIGISRTFQIMNSFPELSVLDNVALGCLFGTKDGYKNLTSARNEAKHWLDFVHMSHHAPKKARLLSGPESKRLELAKALAMRPKLLLLDEVMAGLNHKEIEDLVQMIQKVRDEGITILVIEHVMRAIQNLCERLIVIHHGKKIAEGKTQEVLNDAKVIEAYLGKKRL